MANVFSPFGFRQYRQIEGAQPTMGFETFRLNSSDPAIIYTGDPVITANAAGFAAGNYYGRYITGSSAGTAGGSSLATLGIFVGCKFYNPSVARTVWSPYWPGNQQAAGPDVEAYVITNPLSLWIVQSSTNSLIGSSNIGGGILFNNTTSSAFSSQTTGISGVSAISTSVTTTGTAPSSYPFRIYDFAGTYSGGVGSPSWDISPAAGSLTGFINGYDVTSAGMVLIVQPLNWLNNVGGLAAGV
jgi:hypothetical protein